MFQLSLLWEEPEVNPINKKARSIPLLNPLCGHGRVFFFSWFGFLIAFWSWYAFPPLLKDVIAKDLDLSQNQIATSNIIALLATLLVRLVAGTACDAFGARWIFAGCLLIGAIPTFLAGTVFSFSQLCALRFFVGILGGSFVPCQVWTTGFFDKNVVGTANSLTAGFGNAGGGITYFAMPAIYNSLVSDGLPTHKAWRVAFVVPGILIVAVALALLILCPDTPSGKWAEKEHAAQNEARRASIASSNAAVPATSGGRDEKTQGMTGADSPPNEKDEKKISRSPSDSEDNEAQVGESYEVDAAMAEVIRKPTWKETFKVMTSPQTIVLGAYPGELFGENISGLSLQESGNWAAMFGMLNAVFRPLGGVVSDYAYRKTKSVWAKKALLHAYLLITGAFLVALGVTDPHSLGMMVGLINIGAAFFLEGANGLNFSLVPHVHPHTNGIVSGVTGACGNLGGIVFAVVFRYNKSYGGSIWIIGVMILAINIAVCWIKPLPKGQIGGH